VDVSERRGLDVVVLGSDRQLLAAPWRRQEPVGLSALLDEWRPVMLAIDSPPTWGTTGTSRHAERELARLGIPCFRTPSDPLRYQHRFYNWMRAGHEAFAAAAAAGYPPYWGGPSPAGHALEVFPHAAAVALRGARPPTGTARRPGEKRRWRVGVLETAGVDTSLLLSLDAVDATLAALTAVLVAAGSWFTLGHPDDGYVVLPGSCPAQPYRHEV
jgi:predicted nuclease with RNAse H fold